MMKKYSNNYQDSLSLGVSSLYPEMPAAENDQPEYNGDELHELSFVFSIYHPQERSQPETQISSSPKYYG